MSDEKVFTSKWYASKLNGAQEVVLLSRSESFSSICILDEGKCDTVMNKFIHDDRQAAEVQAMERLRGAADYDRELVRKGIESLVSLTGMLQDAIDTDKCGYLTTWTSVIAREAGYLGDRCKSLVALHHAKANKVAT